MDHHVFSVSSQPVHTRISLPLPHARSGTARKRVYPASGYTAGSHTGIEHDPGTPAGSDDSWSCGGKTDGYVDRSG